ncbi:MAG: ABC transporter [Porticoccaceae bacterium]|jgi:phospholipid-binding lipoprotein MlaA|nr:ABC transporter [Porticoccaceae bacterium]
MGNKHLPVLLVLPLLTACAGSRVAEESHPRDPWEGYNRAMYSFNRTLDKAVLRPVARGYDWVLPGPVQDGVGNVFTNLHYPVVILNLALQGRPLDSGVALGRFVVNSTLGIAGVFDVATRLEIPEFDEDFGQTLAVWGWRDSRYLMLPLLGPSTLRDGPALGVDWATDVAWNWARDEAGYGLVAVEVVDTRAGLLDREDDLEEAYDEYLFVRDAWLQHRDFLIDNGESELPDYEDFLEDGE